MNRRHLLATLPAIAVAACSTTGKTTTVTINVAQAVAYTDAGVAAVYAFIAFPGVENALGSKLGEVQTLVSAVAYVGAALHTAAGASQTFTFDTSSPPAFLATLATDLGTLKLDVAAAMTALGSGAQSQVTAYYQATVAALAAIAALFEIQAA